MQLQEGHSGPAHRDGSLQKMENHQIGTDATQAAHIEKVVGERGYAQKSAKTDSNLRIWVRRWWRVIPSWVWSNRQPEKRAQMEADVTRVALGQLNPGAGIQNTMVPMLDAYRTVEQKKRELGTPSSNFPSGGGGKQRRGGGGGAGVWTITLHRASMRGMPRGRHRTRPPRAAIFEVV